MKFLKAPSTSLIKPSAAALAPGSQDTAKTQSARRRYRWLAAPAAAILALLAVLLMYLHQAKPAQPSPVVIAEHQSTQASTSQMSLIASQIRHGLVNADNFNRRAARRAIASINRFFATLEKRKFTRFYSDATDLHSQFDTLWDHLPDSSGQHVKSLLAEDFQDDVLSKKVLKLRLHDIIATFEQRLAASNNTLRSKWIDDLTVDVASGALPQSLSIRHLVVHEWAAAITETVNAAELSDNGKIAGQVAGTVATFALPMTGISLGLTAEESIMGVGAAGAPETLGSSVVAGIVVEYGVNWIYDAWAHPQAKMRRAVVEAMEKMRKRLLDGAGDRRGLRAIFHDAAQDNSQACRAAAAKVVRSIRESI